MVLAGKVSKMDLLPFILKLDFHCIKCRGRKSTIRYCTRQHTEAIEPRTRPTPTREVFNPHPMTFQSTQETPPPETPPIPLTQLAPEHLDVRCESCGYEFYMECADK